MLMLCSERSSGSLSKQLNFLRSCLRDFKIDGKFNYPRESDSLASCTTTSSVLCNSFKELFLLCLHPVFRAKADAKVRLFFEPPNFFREKSDKKQKVFAFYDNAKTLYLIIYKRGYSKISSMDVASSTSWSPDSSKTQGSYPAGISNTASGLYPRRLSLYTRCI